MNLLCHTLPIGGAQTHGGTQKDSFMVVQFEFRPQFFHSFLFGTYIQGDLVFLTDNFIAPKKIFGR
jgi:hypothetical protein